MDLKILYEDNDLLAIDKPAGVVVFPEGTESIARSDRAMSDRAMTVIDWLLEKYPDLKNVGESPRYGMVHRLDKDTSGVLLVAKTPQALIFLQKQFKNREVEKKYVALATGAVKNDSDTIHTLIGRSKSDPRKQTAHSLDYTGKTGLREAITEYRVLQRYETPTSLKLRGATSNEYTLLEVEIKTGRKHQIRCHLAYLRHPIAGDKVYGFKDSPMPEGLKRQFLHAGYLKITLLDGQMKEIHSDLPEDLQQIIQNLKIKD